MVQYYFLNEMHIKYEVLRFFPNKKNTPETFLDFYDETTSFFRDQHFLVDYLPMRMDSNFIFSEFFNIHHNADNTKNNFKVCDFDDYYRKYLKIICMLVGYGESVFFESSIFYNFDQAKKLDNTLISNVYNKSSKIFELSPENINLFVNLLQDSLNNKYNLVIYLPTLDIIIEVKDLLLNCLVFGDSSLLSRIAQVEGLYFYNYSRPLS